MVKQILIIGYGIVGKNLAMELGVLNPDVYDKYNTVCNTRKNIKYDIAFICVDTPFIDSSNPCDTSEVYNAINENDANIFVIKSTVLPGTCEAIAKKTNKKIVFSPEYYGSTQFSNNYVYDFTILGGEKKTCCDIIQVLQNIYDCRHRFAITNWKTAELVKYMENSYLATKVSFCIQFWNIAQECGVNYEELRELFILDPRVDPANTFVFNDHPFWSSHCYDKDLAAIATVYNAPLVKEIINYNEQMKNEISGKGD